MKFLDLSIRSKLHLTMGLQSILLIVVGVVGFFGTRTANQNFQTMFEGRMLPAAWMHEITHAAAQEPRNHRGRRN